MLWKRNLLCHDVPIGIWSILGFQILDLVQQEMVRIMAMLVGIGFCLVSSMFETFRLVSEKVVPSAPWLVIGSWPSKYLVFCFLHKVHENFWIMQIKLPSWICIPALWAGIWGVPVVEISSQIRIAGIVQMMETFNLESFQVRDHLTRTQRRSIWISDGLAPWSDRRCKTWGFIAHLESLRAWTFNANLISLSASLFKPSKLSP